MPHYRVSINIRRTGHRWTRVDTALAVTAAALVALLLAGGQYLLVLFTILGAAAITVVLAIWRGLPPISDAPLTLPHSARPAIAAAPRAIEAAPGPRAEIKAGQ
jgi:hypothetical protein